MDTVDSDNRTEDVKMRGNDYDVGVDRVVK